MIYKWGGDFIVDNFPRGGGGFSQGAIFSGEKFWGVIFTGGAFIGGYFLGGNFPDTITLFA